jgi:hypothetical protein
MYDVQLDLRRGQQSEHRRAQRKRDESDNKDDGHVNYSD